MQLNICLENIQCEFQPLVSIGYRVVPVLVRSFVLFLKKHSCIINNIVVSIFSILLLRLGGLNFGTQLNICLENIQCEFQPLVSIGYRVVPVLVRSFVLFLKKYSVFMFFNFTFEQEVSILVHNQIIFQILALNLY